MKSSAVKAPELPPTETAAIRYVNGNMSFSVRTPANAPCGPKFDLTTSDSGLSKAADLVPLLFQHGITFAPGDYTAEAVYLPSWRGDACALGAQLSQYLGGTWSWDGHTLTLAKQRDVTGFVPASLVKQFAKDLSTLGVPVKTSNTGVFAGSLDRNQIDILQQYIANFRRGVPMVSVQVVVVSLHDTFTKGGGFDWQSFTAALGNPRVLRSLGINVLAPPQNSQTPGQNGGTNGTGSGTGAGDTPAPPAATTGGGAVFSGGSLSLVAASPSVGVSDVLSLLSIYGRLQTIQNASVMALSGTEVKLSSVTKTPYVSGVGVSGIGGQGSSAVLGSSQTATATSGLTLSIVPSYSPGERFISIDIKASQNAVQGFVNLNAGNQIGSLSQPITQQQSIDSTITVEAGGSAVIGGLTYTTDKDNSSAPVFAPQAGTKSTNETRDELFIIVRPTVTVYQ